MGRSRSGIQGNTPADRKAQKIRRNNGKTKVLSPAAQRKTRAQIISTAVWLTSCFLPVAVFSVATEGHTKEAHPHFLLTPHYGVLSVSDLKKDILKNGNTFWQCFPTKSVSVNYDKWKDSDPLGRFDRIVTMCLFEISAGMREFGVSLLVGGQTELKFARISSTTGNH